MDMDSACAREEEKLDIFSEISSIFNHIMYSRFLL